MYATLNNQDTIVAIASASGGAARGIVRVSGPDTLACLEKCFRTADGKSLSEITIAHVVRGDLLLPAPLGGVSGELYVWPTSRSYTRQPAAEIHIPGSPPLLDAAVAAVCANGGRIARPGEFTLRAFLAGRLDLTQAEAVLGVIDARGESDLRMALEQLAGNFAAPLHLLRDQLLDSLASLEAGLDFVDEDIEFITTSALESQLQAAQEQIDKLLGRLENRSEHAPELRVVLIGYPNVGKSSLFNLLLSETAAIVSPTAGATRDYLVRSMDLDGLRCLLIDTAGLSDQTVTSDVVNAALDASQKQHSHADLQLFCLDATRPLNDWETKQLRNHEQQQRLIVWTKIDRCTNSDPHEEEKYLSTPEATAATSSETGAGLAELRQLIRDRLSSIVPDTNVLASVAARCRESLRLASIGLQHGRETIATNAGQELLAADLRLAIEELSKVVGAVYTDDILDRIFSRFCIGK